jgi:hypothetical protein
MKDYRVQDYSIRMEYFEKYFYWSLKTYDCDPPLFLMNYVNNRMELNIEQRFWLAWLYGNNYQLATSWVIMNEFPDFENVDLDRLTESNNDNYKRLRYQSDQKWQKGHLPKMFESYRENIYKLGNNQQEAFSKICSSVYPAENFNKLYKYISDNSFKFGRYSSWFYIQTLKETCGINVESNDLLLSDNNTHAQRDGLCYAAALDEFVGDKTLYKDKSVIKTLDEISVSIIDNIKSKYPEVKVDMFLLETALCAFKKTFRKTRGRYLGYYLDRQLEDIKEVENDGWEGIDWQLMWQGRDEILDIRTNRLCGVNKEDMEFFLNTGQIKFIDYVYKG